MTSFRITCHDQTFEPIKINKYIVNEKLLSIDETNFNLLETIPRKFQGNRKDSQKFYKGRNPLTYQTIGPWIIKDDVPLKKKKVQIPGFNKN